MAPTELTRDFIDRRAATFHGAFGEDSYFNRSTSRYQSTEVFELEEILRRFKSTASLQSDLDFDVLQCTWNDVLRELERAQDAAAESESSGKKLHRKVWRGLGTTGADIFGPGLAALPDELGVLHGGLALIFTLARQRAQNRRKILSAFEDIPNVIMMASDKVENIPRDRPRGDQLHRTVRDLQQTLLRVLPLLIEKLNPGTLGQRIKSPFKSVDVDDLLSEVRNSSNRVRACSEGMMDKFLVETHMTVHDSYEITQNIQTTTHKTGGDVEELRGTIEQLVQQQKDFQLTLESMSGKNNLLSFLQEYLKHGEGEEIKSPEPSLPAYEPATPVTPGQLLRLMNVHQLRALDAEQHIANRGNSLDRDAMSHAQSMFQTTQVKQLLQSPESGVVLVNGLTDRSQHGKISPLTHICATLTHALRRSPGRNVVLAFFCGQHTTTKDDLPGPQGLMRSLVAFLVLELVQKSYISDSAPIYFPELEEDFSELSFTDICQLFYRLVKLIPKGVTVQCIVDGISHYERPQWKEDFDLMMECFGGIITNNDGGAIFKLLLTSPTQSRWLPSILEPHQRVSLRNTNMGRRRRMEVDTYLQTTAESSTSQQYQ